LSLDAAREPRFEAPPLPLQAEVRLLDVQADRMLTLSAKGLTLYRLME
jgi:hypothetical protein